jgi:hypothetical protein
MPHTSAWASVENLKPSMVSAAISIYAARGLIALSLSPIARLRSINS